ncbi:hypothetical protein M3O75_15405 [Klebsiella pneumoniae]|nr:hypothetical protein [Klebsiella pneumoniae]
MRQFSRTRNASSGVWRCVRVSPGRLFEHLLLSITHDGAQHIVAGD